MSSFLEENVGPDEVVVCDLGTHKAYLLENGTRTRWQALRSDKSRRLFLAALPVGALIMALPTVAQAASCLDVCGFGDRKKACKHNGGCGGVCRAPGICR